ncbi:hypothetical protein BH11PLA1_BH11PLA1_17400 [soil metagenome]
MRRALRILLWLGAGAAVNVTVVMACARWQDRNEDGGEAAAPTAVSALARDYLDDPGYLASFGSGSISGLEMSAAGSLGRTRARATRWIGDRYSDSRTHEETRFGLPFRAMQFTEHSYSDMITWPGVGTWRVAGWRGGWPLSEGEQGEGFGDDIRYVYPLEILPLGFAANTVIYAAALFPIPILIGRFRARGRVRRSVCGRCAYPLGTVGVCSECGSPKSVS